MSELPFPNTVRRALGLPLRLTFVRKPQLESQHTSYLPNVNLQDGSIIFGDHSWGLGLLSPRACRNFGAFAHFFFTSYCPSGFLAGRTKAQS